VDGVFVPKALEDRPEGVGLEELRIAGVEVRVEWLGTPLARDPNFVQTATARASSRTLPYGHLFGH
jgi:hypothetical protein